MKNIKQTNSFKVPAWTGLGRLFLGTLLLAFGLTAFLVNEADAAAAVKVCFCHFKGNTEGITICTSDPGHQRGHIKHGDIGFGCECGDGVCDPLVPEEEDCSTCSIDCGACGTCGDGTEEEGEECGDGTLTCPNPDDVCVGCRCVGTCGNGVVDPGEECDGSSDCNASCQFAVCGDNVAEGSEQCDGSDIGVCTVCNDSCQCCPDADSDGVCDPCETDADCADDPGICTASSICVNGECVAPPIDCNDDDICTDDSCDPELGCIRTPNQNATPCYSGPDGTEGVGVCVAGGETCGEGSSECLGEVVPGDEICADGLDNNCDGETDEEPCISGGASGDLTGSIGGCSLVR